MIFSTAGVNTGGSTKRYNIRVTLGSNNANNGSGTVVPLPLLLSSSQIGQATGTLVSLPISLATT